MKREQSGTFLSAVFVDYDNIYLSLKRKSEDAAKKFAKDAGLWLRGIESGSLITPTNGPGTEGTRRLVMNRCYGNPVPRRNTSDNSTDMSSFPFVRHHFLRSGFEVVDCPPLTAQLKNSSDIRMVMDLRDLLTHPTYFDEFVILSGDADFTPVLHRLRAHARRTVIFANDYTAAPYTAISDGEIRESDLISLLLEGRIGAEPASIAAAQLDAAALEAIRRDIIADVTAAVRAATSPVPLEVLADRAVRAIGHDRTIGTSWAGAGGFRDLLAQSLPEGLRLSGEPPYVVIDTRRHIAVPVAQPALAEFEPRAIAQQQPAHYAPQQIATAPLAREIPAPRNLAVPASTMQPSAQIQPQVQQAVAQPAPQAPVYQAPAYAEAQAAPTRARQPEYAAPIAPAQPATRAAELIQTATPSSIQQSIARIHEACQAPPLAPPEYRALFEVMAQEVTDNGLIGTQTLVNIAQRAQERGLDVRRDDVRFVLEVVSEADPWFEQGATANLFAGRFRNFVVARCRSQGLNLSADELDLIEAWFAGTAQAQPNAMAPIQRQAYQPAPSAPVQQVTSRPAAPIAPQADQRPDPRQGYWSLEEGRQHVAEQRQAPRAPAPQPVAAEPIGEDFPRIVRTRLRG